MTVIDGHVHPFVPVSSRFPRDAQPLFPADLAAPVETLLADMESVGVDKAVLVGLSPHDGYLAECLVRFPGVFAAVLVHAPGETADHVLRRLEVSGARGLRFMGLAAAGTTDPADVPALPVLRALAAEGHVCWLYPRVDDLPVLPALLSDLGDLHVVLNHLGFCLPERPPAAADSPGVAATRPPSTLETVCDLARFSGSG